MSLSREKNYLLCLLAKQDYSRKQLFDKLYKRANILQEQIEDLLDEFEQNNWVSDKRFAEIFVNSEIDKLRGRKRIVNAAVYQKGLPQELVEGFLTLLNVDWFKLCKKCLYKKYKDFEMLQIDPKLKQKAINYLIYNGFSYDEIHYVITTNT
ncbi:regulatory protein RecX [Allofrancisella guangzhouensis]|uniref:Regulatory protein RecX n=1 Tax=Allofrancisella guangzhouensis TaxID=594679 RepID=A0A0A8E2W5_9GAMM|nr:regulatory protein RecX [Allofrancisella guangzhouensis]AJC48348.1 RecX family transcriptional regulator [Allofrancisella guangzhouensis]MBK2026560.1 regulatory protein RecX [Allofrancisella guangzhouensis]MBK2044304.1 regulatory protein RecX [Allofrancisella guangzhouensis]MBK2045547.1 regulatory protein RecX [Allofrancisella guangzhouensis]